MGEERVKGYAEGFRVGWNKSEERFMPIARRIILKFGFDDQLEHTLKFVKEELKKDVLSEGNE